MRVVVGFTGTRAGMTPKQLQRFTRLVVVDWELHHGDCIGADAQAHQIARRAGATVVVHPPTRSSSRRAFCDYDFRLNPLPYLKRNHAIVDATSRLIATPLEYQEQQRSGTWATIRYARQLKRPITIILPNGILQYDKP